MRAQVFDRQAAMGKFNVYSGISGDMVQSRTNTKWLPYFVCMIFVLLLVYNDSRFVGVPGVLRDRDRLFGIIPYNLAIVAPVLGFAVLYDAVVRELIFSLKHAVVCVVIVFSLMWGWLRVHDREFLMIDAREIVWFWAGVCFFRLAWRSGRVEWLLYKFAFLATVLCYFILKYSVPDSVEGTVRYYDTLHFDYDALLIGVVGVLFMRFSFRGYFRLILYSALLLALLYLGLIMSASRSIGLHTGIFIVVAVIAALRLSRSWSFAYSPPVARLSLIAGAVLIAAGGAVVAGKLLQGKSVLVERLGVDTFLSDETRVYEARHNLGAMTGVEKIFGRGLGTPVLATNGAYLAPALHLGLFTFIYKLGYPLGGGIAIFLLFVVPYHIIKDLIRPSPKNEFRIAVHGPIYISWLSLLVVSGGLSLYATFGVGVAFGSFVTSKRQIARPPLPRHLLPAGSKLISE